MVLYPEGFVLNLEGRETAKFHMSCRSFSQVFPEFLKAVLGRPELWVCGCVCGGAGQINVLAPLKTGIF
jgi:hypothetical protein